MKPTTLNLFTFLRNSGRRRKMLSALVIGILYMIGLPAVTHAAGPDRVSGYDNVNITITRDYAVAGVGQDSIKVNISPTPAPGEKIEFDWAGFGILADVDAQGNAYFGVGAGAAGTLIVTIKRGANGPIIGTATLTFIAAPGPVDPAKSYLEIIQSPVTADGTSTDIVRAHLFDANGNVVTQSTPVVFDMQSGTATFTSPGTPAPGSGNAVGGTIDAKLTSTVVGSVVVHAVAGGIPIANVVTVKFIAGAVDPTKSYLEVIQNPAAADGATEDIVRAHLFDQYGHPLTDTVVTFAIVSGTATFSSASTGPTVAGTLDAKLVSNVIGDVQVSATVKVNGVDVAISSSPVTVQFVTGPPDVTNRKTELVVDISQAAADGSSITKIHAHLVDKNGNLVNTPVDLTFFIIPSGPADATAVPSSLHFVGIPDANGDVYLTITNTTVGTVQWGASETHGGVTSNIIYGSPAPVQFVDNVPDVTKPQTMLVVDKQQATADGADITRIHAHLVNPSGVVWDNKAVTIEFFIIPSGAADATAALSLNGPNTIVTDASGNIYLTITDTKVGTVQLGARITVNGVTSTITFGSPAPVTFVSGPAVPSAPGAPSDPNAPGGTTGTQLYITKNFAPADGASVDSVTAHITDKNGNPVKDEVVTFSIRAGGTSTATAKLVGTVTVKTDANGIATISVTNTVSGTVWIDASIDYGGNPTSLIDGSYKEITFTDIPDVTNQDTRLIVIVYEALADGTSTTVVKAHVVSQAGAVLPGVEVTFKVDSGSATIVTPGPWITDANGDVSIELTNTKPGFALITATVKVSGVDKAITFGSPARVKFASINIYVPKVFTPNGDGSNDVLKPILVGIKEFHYFNVYNRWGNLIFTTRDPNQGWDGTFKGVAQPVETYLWIAEGVDINDKKIVAKGMTSLVR